MTWLQTASGRAYDLVRPDWRQVDFDVDVPEALARIARFTGHVRSGPYSVAQHSVLGADAIFRETRSREAAAAFLIHDAHEAYVGDMATPISGALVEIARELGGDACAVLMRSCLRELKSRQDQAIFRATGMAGAMAAYATLVHRTDLGMLATERAHLLGKSPQPWHPSVEAAQPIRITGRITCWTWPHAADEYRDRLRRYLPETFGPVRPSLSPGPVPGFAARQAAKPPARKTLTEA